MQPWWDQLFSWQIFRTSLWGVAEKRKDGIANTAELQNSSFDVWDGKSLFLGGKQCTSYCTFSQSIQKVKNQPLPPAAWASISPAKNDSVYPLVLGVQLLALPSILPGEVPWPDRDVGSSQFSPCRGVGSPLLAQLQGGNHRAVAAGRQVRERDFQVSGCQWES